ncbi:flagellar hook-basal body complex protein [Nitrincola sp.]|uniref:flagellar hook-basal body complex protein n=1 Tax=Nitrincola sp. TaxID=1926584 RepID=UPI003A929A55
MAGFNTAVTGLKASTTLLDVAGNNIANSSTVGFKSSRTEFGDIYATAVVGAGSSNTPGSGVTVTDIAQDFSGGTIEFTNSNLDLAINGSGFFMLDDGQGNLTYTRAGAFELDKDGNIVSKNGKYLQGYGLDAQGNQLPIQNLSVTEKESPPKATERVDMAFNIDANENAEDLNIPFAKTDPNSYTYSTTVGTFDSLGNEQSIRFYFAEQRPVREEHTYSDVAWDGAALDFTSAALSGFNLDLASNSGGTEDPNTLYFDDSGTAPYALTSESISKLAGEPSNIDGDPRIDPNTVRLTDTGDLSFEVKAEFVAYGDFVVTNYDGTEAVGNVGERSASEVQALTLNEADGAIFTSEILQQDVTVTVAGIEITVKVPTAAGETKTLDQVGQEIASKEQEILDKNPDIESVSYDTDTNQIRITWKPEAGDVGRVVSGGADANDLFYTEVLNSQTVPQVTVLETGDNSFIGAYRTYAFLNDTDQLDMGKMLDPGETSPDNKSTEVGPIMINFNSTTGVLEAVNGQDVASTGQAPSITILGADPANPLDQILDSDVDQLAGLQLDISGSSQFASESIVKSQQQDGYTKGDLIGVSFAETGEMVASYSNGQRANLGLVSIATFENQDGLQPSGNTEWIATLASGNAIMNPPGTGLNGTLRSAALEQSNVDLSEELVKLIEGQRNFQANSKTLETLNTVTQAILQI